MAKQVKYVDIKPITFPSGSLKHYPQGVSFPNDKNILEVDDSELKSILKKKNCQKPVFELIKKEKKVDKDDFESEEL